MKGRILPSANISDPSVSTGWYAAQKIEQANAHRNGFALKRHCENAHGGDTDPKCNACIELQQKMEEV